MRKIIVSEFISLDGVIEAPGPDASGFKFEGWTMPYSNEAISKFKFDELFNTDALLLGKITYDGFAKAWPQRSGDAFSDKFNSMPKYVVSNNLEQTAWNNSHIIKGDVVNQIDWLKNQTGKSIMVNGSAILFKLLIQNKLVDEIVLLVYPIVLGTGKKLFKEDVDVKLTLLESKTLSPEVVLLRYQPVF